MIPLLVLRPEPGATATARRARALGLAPIVAPLFTIAPLAWTPPPAEAFDAVMLTSANAVRHAGPALARYRALPAYAVGEATAAAARAAGFARVQAADGDAADLVAMLAAEGVARALHPCGVDRREATHRAVRIERVEVYHAAPVATLPAAISEAIAHTRRHPGHAPGSTVTPHRPSSDMHHGGCRNESGMTEGRPTGQLAANAVAAIALLHSPRAAALFAALLDTPSRARVGIAAISPAAAEAAGPGWCALAVAAAPTDAALLAVAARLCEERG